MQTRIVSPKGAAVLLVAAVAACATVPSGRSSGAAPATSQYDLIITNGQIVDGTGNPWFFGDVAVRGDRIVAVTPPHALDRASAKQTIDASGLVVAPGFIDMQGQSENAFTVGDGRAISKVTQGVTTEILGEGSTPAPVNDAILATSDTASHMQRARQRFRGEHGFGTWLAAMQSHGIAVNVGSYLGAETVREYAMGSDPAKPLAAQLDTMRRVVRDAMRDGAFGVASALIYPPGVYAGTPELIEIARTMAPYHGTYITHMRSEGDSLLQATDEALRIGRDGGVPVIIYHLKASSQRNWPKERALLAKIDSARASGQDVTTTMYPYPASSNGLASCVPPYVSANGKLLDNLRDPTNRARITREMDDPSTGVGADCQGLPPHAIMVVGFERPEFKKYEGKRLDEIAAAMNTSWQNAIIDILVAGDSPGRVTFSMDEANVAMQLPKPWMMFGTDASAWNPADSAEGLTHPRAYGSFPRILGRYVRDEHLLTLEDAVRKMTSLPAGRLGMRDRGELRVGNFADVVIFDAATISDRATYDRPHALSVGVRDVLVNGTPVIRSGTLTNALPGRALHSQAY